MHNRLMNSITSMELQENPFRDLRSLMANCNVLRLQTLDGNCRELSKPKLGRDFVAGTLEDNQTLGIFRLSTLRSVEFAHTSDTPVSFLEHTRRTIGELLANEKFPASAIIGYLEPTGAVQQVRLIGVVRGFLVTDFYQNPAIPIAALRSVELKL